MWIVLGPYPAAPESYLNKNTISGPWNKGQKIPSREYHPIVGSLWAQLSPCWNITLLQFADGLGYCHLQSWYLFIPSIYYKFQIYNLYRVKSCCGIKVMG